nr:acetyltransferase [Vibrio lentus]
MLLRIYKKIKRLLFTFIAKLTLSDSLPKNIKVNNYSRFSKSTLIGSDCHFNGMIILGKGRVSIGDGFHSGKGCEIITDVHNYLGDKLPYDDQYIIKDVIIGNNVWIGKGVTILGGVNIGEGAIVQAKSVVVSDVEPLSIIGGHPARKFSERDKEHYQNLKIKI